MADRTVTSHITVTIGEHTRVYFAFVPTTPTHLDAPGTVTLQAGTLADLAGLAATPIRHDGLREWMPARLLLVEALALAWHRARCHGHQRLLLPAHPVLIGPGSLQLRLWRRLQKPICNITKQRDLASCGGRWWRVRV